MPHIATALAAEVLVAGLSHLTAIRYVSLPDSIVRLESTAGQTVLYIDQGSTAADLSRALLDVLRVFAEGRPDAALDGVQVARLRAVS